MKTMLEDFCLSLSLLLTPELLLLGGISGSPVFLYSRLSLPVLLLKEKEAR